jgi:hypothetical protein
MIWSQSNFPCASWVLFVSASDQFVIIFLSWFCKKLCTTALSLLQTSLVLKYINYFVGPYCRRICVLESKKVIIEGRKLPPPVTCRRWRKHWHCMFITYRVSSHMFAKVCMPVFSSFLQSIGCISRYPTCIE